MALSKSLITIGLMVFLSMHSAFAAIAIDRTRVVFDGGQKSISLNVNNENKKLPYLAQAWIEDAHENKINSPLMVLPPIQRIEPGTKSQLKIQSLQDIRKLPQDKESLFYFNVREIPPRSDKPNTLQLALQTRIKLFYRPEGLKVSTSEGTVPWQEKITLKRQGDYYTVNNPTPYFVTIIDGSNSEKGKSVKGFEPLMIEPKGKGTLKTTVSMLGNSPVLTYVNDYGGRPKLKFLCNGNVCNATPVKE